jgi:AcrR family transcriptional regulator
LESIGVGALARTQSEKYPEIRQNILKQAVRLFADKGYAGTTIIDLAEACESSRGALYHYFESKEEILFHILESHVNLLLEQVQETVAEHKDPLDQCRAVVGTIVLCNAGSQSEQVVLLSYLGQLNKDQQREIIAKQRKIVELVADILIRIDAKHRLNTRNKKAYTMMLFGMINYTYVWYDPKGAVSPRDYAEMTAQVFIRGFTAD